MENNLLSYDKLSEVNNLNLLEKTTLSREGCWVTAETYDEVLLLIQRYETETVSKFSCYTAAKNFGNIDSSAKHHKIRWEDDAISFNGTPFMVLGSKVLDCMHGKDRKISFKEKYKMHSNEKKNTEDTQWKRAQSSKCIKDAIKRCGNMEIGKRMFSIFFPLNVFITVTLLEMLLVYPSQ
ncbi:uncharacterized protein LOC136087322 isoform X2 [Hydra vulgaris]|uniref:Uncharacterized protein LOC136087322 isoform X2 n=1 Tax=Hydra vulgaris TaxID=6087 RepID=A0ABM4CV57_HYDVU